MSGPMLHLIRQALGLKSPVLSAEPRPPLPGPVPDALAAPLPDHRLTLLHLHAILDHLRPIGSGPALAELLVMLDGLTLPLTAAGIMTQQPITVTSEADWRRMTALVTQHNLHSLPVVDAEHRLIGVVPVAVLLRPGASGLTAAHLMQPAQSMPDSADLSELLAAFAKTGQTVLPIEADGTLVGVLTRTDLVAALIRALLHQ